MNDTAVDRERLAITARSVAANTEVLEDGRLDADGRARVAQLAEQLGGEPGVADEASVSAAAGELRTLLASSDGDTEHTWVVWLDDALAGGE
ncbi:hypothetical protein [Actinomycetospora flava]|uniref:Uncharacterized protein n=1 Tax=Actinomycetospora flava TaxID=3129232 RepID=A0ABU8M8X9_9PSEU